MTQLKLTLDDGKEMEFDADYIQSFEKATTPDGHSYVKIEYDGDQDKKSNMFAISDSFELVESLMSAHENQ